MEIKDILNVSLIQTDLQMQSKEEVFEALAQLLVETVMCLIETNLSKVFIRERQKDRPVLGIILLFPIARVLLWRRRGSHSYKSQ